MKNARLTAMASNRFWMLEEGVMSLMIGMIRGVVSPPDVKAAAASDPSMHGKVAVIPLHGVIEQRSSLWADLFGGSSTDTFGAVFDALMRDASVKGIVVDIDSPGGSVPGVLELADKIYAQRGKKPVVGVANSMAASAAYWIGSALDQLYVSPSGSVGSVGVYSMHVDYSRALEQDGITATVFAVPKFKAEFNPVTPLSQESIDYETAEINRIYDQFVSAVARHRNVGVQQVRANFGEGRLVHAEQAIANGMADRIATLEQVIGRVASGRIKPGPYQASESLLRRESVEAAEIASRLRLRGILKTSVDNAATQ